MQVLNNQNIDQWLFEYFEGNLDVTQQATLSDFLAANPEFSADFDAWAESSIPVDNLAFAKLSSSLTTASTGILFNEWFKWGIAMLVLLFVGTGSVYLVDYNRNNEQTANNIVVHNPSTYNINRINSSYAIPASFEESNSSNIDNHSIAMNTSANHSANTNGNNDLSGVVTSVSFQSDEDINDNTVEVVDYPELSGYSDEDFGGFTTLSEGKSISEEGRIVKVVVRKLKDIQKSLGLINLRDPYFVAPNSAVLNVNPSMAGSMGMPRFETVTRLQWPESTSNSTALSFNYDAYSYKLKAGIGIQYNSYSYKEGLYKNSDVSFIYAYKMRVKNMLSIEPSIKLSINNQSVNWDKMPSVGKIEPIAGSVFDVPNQSVVPSGIGKQIYSDLSTGLLINTSIFYTGISVNHLFGHNNRDLFSLDFENASTKSPLAVDMIWGCDFKRNAQSNVILSPQVYYHNTGTYSQTWFTAGFRYNWLALGAGASDKGGLVANIGIQGEQFQLGYKFDKSKSYSLNTSLPSHEINLRIFLQKRDKKSDHLLSYYH